MQMEKNPHLYIIAGPNGSGKTTFVRRFLPYYADCINFVNADLIAAGLSPFSPDVAAIKAGKIMLDQILPHPMILPLRRPWREDRTSGLSGI